MRAATPVLDAATSNQVFCVRIAIGILKASRQGGGVVRAGSEAQRNCRFRLQYLKPPEGVATFVLGRWIRTNPK